MKNHNYNLIKLLHSGLDDLWRLERFYLKDAKACTSCIKALGSMHKDVKRHVARLSKELTLHGQAEKLD